MSHFDPNSPEDVLRHFGGRPALAVANSVLWRRSATPRELIHGYEDVVEHLSSIGTLPHDQDEALRATAAAHPAAADAALERALGLRELLFRLLSAVAAGEPPAAADLDAFNAATAEALSRSTVEPADGGFRRGWAADGAGALDVPAWEVARDAPRAAARPGGARPAQAVPGTGVRLAVPRREPQPLSPLVRPSPVRQPRARQEPLPPAAGQRDPVGQVVEQLDGPVVGQHLRPQPRRQHPEVDARRAPRRRPRRRAATPGRGRWPAGRRRTTAPGGQRRRPPASGARGGAGRSRGSRRRARRARPARRSRSARRTRRRRPARDGRRRRPGVRAASAAGG